nr:hypothetical protein [Staphylococcus haemolyticus]
MLLGTSAANVVADKLLNVVGVDIFLTDVGDVAYVVVASLSLE